MLGFLSQDLLSFCLYRSFPSGTRLINLWLKEVFGHGIQSIWTVIKPSSTSNTTLCSIHLCLVCCTMWSKCQILVYPIIHILRTFIIPKVITMSIAVTLINILHDISGHPLREHPTIALSLLQLCREVISGICTLISEVEVLHQLKLVLGEVVSHKCFIPGLILKPKIFSRSPRLEYGQHCLTVILPVSKITPWKRSTHKIGYHIMLPGIKLYPMGLMQWMTLQELIWFISRFLITVRL